MFSKKTVIPALAAAGLFGAAALTLDVDIRLKDSRAEAAPSTLGWSPTKPYPSAGRLLPGHRGVGPG